MRTRRAVIVMLLVAAFDNAMAESYPITRPINDGTWSYKFVRFFEYGTEMGKGKVAVKKEGSKFVAPFRSDKNVSFELHFWANESGNWRDVVGYVDRLGTPEWHAPITGQAMIVKLTDNSCRQEVVVATQDELKSTFYIDRPAACP